MSEDNQLENNMEADTTLGEPISTSTTAAVDNGDDIPSNINNNHPLMSYFDSDKSIYYCLWIYSYNCSYNLRSVGLKIYCKFLIMMRVEVSLYLFYPCILSLHKDNYLMTVLLYDRYPAACVETKHNNT